MAFSNLIQKKHFRNPAFSPSARSEEIKMAELGVARLSVQVPVASGTAHLEHAGGSLKRPLRA
jgi:hypothetical protein